MAHIVDWSLPESALMKKLLHLSKAQLIKACKYQNVKYTANKKQCIEAIIAANKQRPIQKQKATKKEQTNKQTAFAEEKDKGAVGQPSIPASTTDDFETASAHSTDPDIEDVDHEESEHKTSNSPILKEQEATTIDDEHKIAIKISSNYFPSGGYAMPMDAIARVLLLGVYDDDHPLSVFRGMRYIVRQIWQLAIQFNRHHYSSCFKTDAKWNPEDEDQHWLSRVEPKGSLSFRLINQTEHCYYPYGQRPVNYMALKFPPPQQEEININMMPLQMFSAYNDHEVSYTEQLPPALHGYIEWIRACEQALPSQQGKICYLTIHESYVHKGRTQRRPGVHIELPTKAAGGESSWFDGWGGGYEQDGGIFIASNVDNTCAVWQCACVDRTIMDRFGGMQHLKSVLPNDRKQLLEGHKLYWITDRTPHEALPMEKSGWRQFFRLVSSELSVWYEAHSTKNPVGITPNAKRTKILKENKFISVS